MDRWITLLLSIVSLQNILWERHIIGILMGFQQFGQKALINICFVLDTVFTVGCLEKYETVLAFEWLVKW
jgi:hypothetical protein